MADRADLDAALEVITKRHERITILHCVSEYPTHPDNTNLLTVRYLQKEFPGYEIGYSDHTIGISAPVAAVALGRQGHREACHARPADEGHRSGRIARAGRCFPDGARYPPDGAIDGAGSPVHRSSRYRREAQARAIRGCESGHRGRGIVREEDLHLLSPGSGLRWSQRGLVVGGRALRRLLAGELVQAEDVSAAAPAEGR